MGLAVWGAGGGGGMMGCRDDTGVSDWSVGVGPIGRCERVRFGRGGRNRFGQDRCDTVQHGSLSSVDGFSGRFRASVGGAQGAE